MPQADLHLDKIIDVMALAVQLDGIGKKISDAESAAALRPQVIDALRKTLEDGRTRAEALLRRGWRRGALRHAPVTADGHSDQPAL